MSINSSATRKAGPFSGDGVTVNFPFTFKVFQASDLLVVRTDASGTETTQTLTTQYTVSLNSNQDTTPGGTVTMVTAPPTGYLLTLGSQVAQTQPTVLTNTGGFYPTVINDMLDRVTILVQQLSEKLGRALTLPFSVSSSVSAQLPYPVSNKVIGWNATATGLQNLDMSTIASIVAYGTAASDIFTGTGAQTAFVLSNNPGALNNLDVAIGGVTQLPGVDYNWISGTTVTFTTAPPNGAKVLIRYMQALALGTADAGSVQYIPAGTGAVATTVQSKLRESLSLKDFGAVGDGTTPDTAAVTAANAVAKKKFTPGGTYLTTIASASLAGPYWGEGQIKDAAGNKRAPWFSQISAAPSSLGVESSIDTAFNGDWSKSQIPMEHRITGTATLGQPTTGYLYRPEVMPHYTYLYNSSGWNQQTAGNDGRTGLSAYRVKIDQYGQGDLIAYNAAAFVTGSRAGQTNFLAAPAAVLFNGDMTAGAAGVYMNPYETYCSDGGFDAACIGIVNNFSRTNATGALSTVWGGYRAQSVGSAACDFLISATGKWQTGLDFAMTSLDFGANQAAISLKAGQRIYLNNAAIASGSLAADWRSTVFNGDYISYSGGAMLFVAGGNPSLQVSSGQVTVTQSFKHTGTSFGVFNAAPVGQLTGWGTPTGNSVISNFPGASATLTQTSNAVAQIITYLKQTGLFGA